MKKLFLMGRSEAGKTSLVQALKGEKLHYTKTQYTNTTERVIDSPGEYSETKNFAHALACFSFEADVIGVLMAADEPYSLFCPACQSFVNRPLIGIITKIHSPYANLPMVRSWMKMTGWLSLCSVPIIPVRFPQTTTQSSARSFPPWTSTPMPPI